ncbi:facilitated trehalose transporter Tret1-like [Coccinella septempunctata]|uniref:facilitated trehalose transporter Tret1-like n=1 Tax=Coccinella septempunctata TaxID=41139 RepID=UPI001D07E3E4|nr:facilitated trehalose transporter Tret1-like [Coccinella septempunctata]XP_044753428.1 facilitated trehalose transporter Tret1-like [Coccinella septempunctata]
MQFQLFSRNYYEYIAVFIGHLGVFIAALSMTWTSPTLPKLTGIEDNPLHRIITPDEQSLLGSIPILGSLVGTFLSGYLAKIYGRKPIFIFLGIPALASYAIIAVSTNIWQLYTARIIGGFALGGFFTVDTMYFAEVAANSNRGLLGTAMTCFINFGLLFVLIIGPWTPFIPFHIVLALIPAIFMVLVYFFLPESPYYLIQKDYNEAEKCLRNLRGVPDVKDELDSIRDSLNQENQATWKNVLDDNGLRRGLVIGCGLVICQQLSGTAVIMSYGQTIFEEAGGGVPSEIGPIIIASIQFLVGFIAPSIVDKSGRKMLLLISYVGITVAHLLFGSYFILKNKMENVGWMSWLPIASLVLYITTYSLGSGPLPWTIIGEIFPLEVKNVATSICITILNVLAFIFLFGFNLLKNQIGIGATFWIFSAFGMLSTIFTYLFVIETKGKSLSEIQKILNT